MSTRHRPSMRTLVAMLLALSLLLMLVVPFVDAAETIALSSDVTLSSQTLDGKVLDASAAATATATVNVLLQRCTVQGAGLNVSGTVSYGAAGPNAINLRVLDTTVKGATLAFRNYLPDGSLVHIVNVTATMKGTTPLFDLQNFYMGWQSREYYGASMKIQGVHATWGTGDGGSVVQVGGSSMSYTNPGQMLSLSEAVVTGAAHVLEITSECIVAYCLFVLGGLIAFDLIEFRDARGAFIYSDPTFGGTFSSSHNGMVRFSNITMTGGQPFFEARYGTTPAVTNHDYGGVVFSAISNDGPLFALVPGADITAYFPTAKYSFRHINVWSVMSGTNSYTANVPNGYDATSDEAWNFYMGNITVAGKLVKTINELESNRLFATQLVGAYGEVTEVRQGGSWPQPSLGTAAGVNCVSATGVTVDFVQLVPGVQRAECNCPSGYYTPYCTTVVDPLVYYDAYSPSPATCDAENCDTCLFGQASQCGACALGYMLTSELGCEIIPCNVTNCKGCATKNVCGSCAKGYKVNDKGQCKKSIPWWVWLIVGIAAAAVVAGIIVLVVCCLRRRKAKESPSSVRASSNTAMRRDQSDATEMARYASFTSAGAAPPSRSAPSGAYQWSSADCNAGRTTQSSQVSFANPLDYDYQ